MRSWFVGTAPTHRTSAGREDGPGSTTLARRMVVGCDRSVPRVADPGRPDMEATRANETMMRAVVVFVGNEVLGATSRHCRPAPSRNVALAVRRPG